LKMSIIIGSAICIAQLLFFVGVQSEKNLRRVGNLHLGNLGVRWQVAGGSKKLKPRT